MKDNIDFGKENIPVLFRKMFIPTLLGMLSTALIVVVDGIFVGRGVGSNGLAAVNIASPLFMLFTGLGLLFGIGASVVVSIHLSKNKHKAANINFTQSLSVSSLLMLIITVLMLVFNKQIAYMFGASDLLLPLALEYINWIVPFSIFNVITIISSFFIRIDGSPKYAMYCSLIPAILNVILDYLFIFPLGWGLKGAALASGLSMVVGGIVSLIYLMFSPRVLHFYKPKLTIKSLRLTARNISYMLMIGFPAFIAEISLAFMVATGNNVFIRLLGEDGVAAFSIACYLFPLIFMMGNAIVESAQPIISFNHGAGYIHRTSHVTKLAVKTGIAFGLVITLFFIFFSKCVVGLFLDSSLNSYHIAVEGIPYFCLASLFFIFNLVIAGYFQSIEKLKAATAIILLRGYLFMFIFFMIMPELCGITGAWLAVPIAEFLTSLLIVVYFVKKNSKYN